MSNEEVRCLVYLVATIIGGGIWLGRVQTKVKRNQDDIRTLFKENAKKVSQTEFERLYSTVTDGLKEIRELIMKK